MPGIGLTTKLPLTLVEMDIRTRAVAALEVQQPLLRMIG